MEPTFDQVKKAARAGKVELIERMGSRADAHGVVAYGAYYVAEWVENLARRSFELSSSQRQELEALGCVVHNLEAEELEDVATEPKAPVIYAGVVVPEPREPRRR